MCIDCKGKMMDQIKQVHGVQRPGKTAKDKKSGSWQARFDNRAARIARDNERRR